MSLTASPVSFDLSTRLRRSRGRSGRVFSINSKLTEPELRLLENAAAQNGKAISEWAREVLIEAAQRTGPDVILVELVATRMLLVNMLKMIGQTRALPEVEYTKIHAEVQKVKRRIARELAEQTQRLNTAKER
jgi:predicted glycosyltransferase